MLHTDRLTLRPFTLEDASAVQAYASEPAFFRYISAGEEDGLVYGLEDARRHIADLLRLAANGYPHWGIIPRGETVPVGAVRFRPFDGGGEPELGYGLASAWSGKGIATEAAGAALVWMLRRRPRVWARTHPDNLPSRRILEKLGFLLAEPDREGRLVFRKGPAPDTKS